MPGPEVGWPNSAKEDLFEEFEEGVKADEDRHVGAYRSSALDSQERLMERAEPYPWFTA
jgi:hypothetical protein